jgi:hypothetical protein
MQTTFLIGALLIFTILAITFNQKNNISLDTDLDQEATITAIELGDAFLEEINRKAFDDNTVSNTVDTVTSLTPSTSLETETGEISKVDFDDIDDFNGYIQKDTLNNLGVFLITVDVYYVDSDYPDIRSSIRTFTKRIDVEISNEYMRKKVKLSYLAAY